MVNLESTHQIQNAGIADDAKLSMLRCVQCVGDAWRRVAGVDPSFRPRPRYQGRGLLPVWTVDAQMWASHHQRLRILRRDCNELQHTHDKPLR